MPLLVVKEANVYRIPGRQSNKGFTAASWDLTKPVFTGQLKVTTIGSACYVKLFDKSTGAEFAQCPVDAYPGLAVESVTDSSRYFVLRLDNGSGQHAFVGMGFTERSDAFDFTVALRDHFKREDTAADIASAKDEPYVPKHATGALTGPIKINIKKKGGATKTDGAKTGGFGGLQPPPGGLGGLSAPPGGLGASFGKMAVSPPPAATNPFGAAPAATTNPFGAAPVASTNPFETAPTTAAPTNDPFGDFASAPTGGENPNGWVKF